MRLVRVKLGRLTLDEEFVTPITRKAGHVIDIGHTRPAGYWSREFGCERPRWPTVRCWLDGEIKDLSPDIVVLVAPERVHVTAAELGEDRWRTPLRMSAA